MQGKPKPHTLWKRRYRARLFRESDPRRFYLRKHKRKLAKKQPKPQGYRPFDMDEWLARQPKTIEELAKAMRLV